MDLPTLFDLCEPRPDVLAGNISESDFAADLAQILRGDATAPGPCWTPSTTPPT